MVVGAAVVPLELLVPPGAPVTAGPLVVAASLSPLGTGDGHAPSPSHITPTAPRTARIALTIALARPPPVDRPPPIASPLWSTGPAGPAVSVLGSYRAGEQRWGWRTALRREGDALVIEATNIEPGGEETRAIEVRLARLTAA